MCGCVHERVYYFPTLLFWFVGRPEHTAQMWVEVEAVRSTCTSKLCHALAEQHSVKVLLAVC